MPAYSKASPVYIISLGAFALGMSSYVTAGLLPMIASSFSVSIAIAAQLVTAFTLAYGLGSPVCVALMPVDRQRAGLLCALGLFVLANVASALSTNFTELLMFRALAGIGAGVYLATGIATSSALSPPERRGKSTAVIMGGMASGTVLGVPLSLMLASHLGWQFALWLIALLGAIAIAGLLVQLPPLPKVQAIPLRRKIALLADTQILLILLVSLLAAISSLGMYTFLAPLITAAHLNVSHSVTLYLWIWGVGGVSGSFLAGPLVDRIKGPTLALWVMIALSVALFLLPNFLSRGQWLVMLPIFVWGAAGWILQVPQNNELLKVRQQQGDGNLGVALNGSALYLGSAVGAASGGLLLLQHWPPAILAYFAGAVAIAGALLQGANLRRKLPI